MKINNKGITLIELVVTIIVMLILSGITVNSIVGNYGLLDNARGIKDKSQNSTGTAENELQNLIAEFDDMRSKNTDKFPGDLTNNGTLDGTPESPYEINSIEDLVAFSKEKNESDFLNKTIVITKDLDFKAKNSYANSGDTDLFGDYNNDSNEEGLMQEIITGGYETPDEFAGTLDGKGHTISNFSIKAIDEKEHYTGFINNLQETGCIKNLNIKGEIEYNIPDTQMLKYHRIGGLLGRNNGGIVENCKVNVNITAIMKDAIISEQANNRQLYIGGLIGNNEGTVNNCTNYGKIYVEINRNRQNSDTSSAVNRVGGLLGELQGKIMNSINYGEIYYKASIVDETIIKSDDNVGGIAGYCSDGSGFSIENCINLGNITTDTTEKAFVGGIVGRIVNSKNEKAINNVYNAGIVTASTHNLGGYLRLSGIAGDGDTHMDYCFNTGKITHNNAAGEDITSYFGAISGDVHSNTAYTNCKYLTGSAPTGTEGGDIDKLKNEIYSLPNLTKEQIIAEMNGNVKNYPTWRLWNLNEISI